MKFKIPKTLFRLGPAREERLPSGKVLSVMTTEIDRSLLPANLGLCDCCSNPVETSWLFPHRAFSIRHAVLIQAFDAGNWACCSQCRPLFEARDVFGIVDRVITLNPDLSPPFLRLRLPAEE